jgi:tripartite-type tricarboxylate transporter receptor subunit TctC
VRADSPLRSGRDLAALLKNDASSVSAAIGTSLGNTGHITLAMVTQAAGGKTSTVKFVATDGKTTTGHSSDPNFDRFFTDLNAVAEVTR